MANGASLTPVKEFHVTDQVKMWTFVCTLVGVAFTLFTAWTTVNKKIERNSTKIEVFDENLREIKNDVKDVGSKQDKILEKLNAIEVRMESKQDRPK